MKKLLLPLLMCSMFHIGFSQPGNPYNQRGIDYVKSLDIISADVKAGRAKEFNGESIQYYKGKIPLQIEANADLAAAVVKTIKSPGFDFSKLLAESSLSLPGKKFLSDIYYVRQSTTLEQYKLLLEQKTADLSRQVITAGEREMLLSVSAIAYQHSRDLQGRHAAGGEPPSGNCILSGPGGSGAVNCILAGAITGFIVGYRICGFWCGLGGAVVGGVLGSFS